MTAASVIRDLGPRHTLMIELDRDLSAEEAEDAHEAIERALSSLPPARRPKFILLAGAARLAAVRVAPRALPGRKRLPRWAR